MTESITLTALSWLATYLVHSTLLIGCVWAFTGACRLDSLTRSLLWKLALVGGLFTATLQTGLGVQPALGLLSLTEPEAAPVPAPVPGRLSVESRLLLISGSDVIRIDESGVCIGPGCELPEWRSPGLMLAGFDSEEDDLSPPELLLTIDEAPVVPMAAAPVPAPEAPSGSQVAGWLVGLFAFGAGASLLRLGFLVRGLRRSLRGRTPIHVGPLHERLSSLVARARIRRLPLRLTVSAGLRSPVALASGEIVVPPEALELEARQQEAMLAHELAHVLRRDPAWLVLAAVIEALLFIQPLNRVARRGMQEAAEELSDDWAVRHIGSGLHLARCLTEVAGWLEREEKPVRLASPMASGSGSLLVRRVRRLLEQQPGARRLAGAWRVMMGLGLLVAVGLGAPGFAPPLARASTPPLAPVSVPWPAMPEPPEPPESLSEELPPVMPSEAELRKIMADARSSMPSEAELRKIMADARSSMPSEAELRKIVAKARKIAGQAVKLDSREIRELQREMARAGRELARAAEEIEREVRGELERDGVNMPQPPMPPRPPGAVMPPMPPMPAAPPAAPQAPGPRGSAMPPTAPMPPAPPQRRPVKRAGSTPV